MTTYMCRDCCRAGVETRHIAPTLMLARWLSRRHQMKVHGRVSA